MKRILRYKNRKGFTLAEVMMAVAIIAILAGVSFIGVAGYLRSMAQLERDGIAKEIFIAAQNHLTMAEGQGFLGVKKNENVGYGANESGDIYYFIVNSGTEVNGNTFDSSSLLGLMLPFGSIDETVRLGGNYIIRYQIKPARVLDVFYCASGNARYTTKFGSEGITYTTAKDNLKGDDKKSDRKNYNGVTVGWFGGDQAINLETADDITDPELELVNSDVLYAKVKNYSAIHTSNDVEIKLIIEGKVSGALASITVENGNRIILDDITTSDRHFSQIGTFADEKNGTFIPGEDIRVYVEAHNNTVLTNIARSAVKTTNSLFGDLMPVTQDSTSYPEISIGSMRHLENLDNRVSAFVPATVVSDAAKVVAKQTTDLDWGEFLPSETTTDNDDKTPSANTVYYNMASTPKGTTEGWCYLPVSPSYTLEYDGDSHSISNVKVDYEGESGLIGTMTKGSVSNLELIDFNITGTGAAGALAGKMTESTVVNVLAHNSSASASTIIISAASAGGLIGSAEKCTVRVSAASLIVSSSGGDAGGLIGTVSGTDSSAVIGCYSGGHLDTSTHEYSSTTFNVTGSGAAGGLIGNAGAASIQYSYSTCSASGATVGGFIGSGSGTIEKCYATGLVKKAGTTTSYEQVGAFAGTYSGTEITNCSYYEIVNETKDSDGKYTGLLKAVNNGDNSNITPFDKTMDTFQAFIPEEWADAYPYDEVLEKYFGDKYNLKTVEQLSSPAPTLTQLAGKTVSGGNLDTTDYYVAKHYGDWPSPEVQVVNETEAENG